MRLPGAQAALVWYYLATPLFAFLDLALGAPVRVAGLGDPLHRGFYYVVLMALGLLARERPAVAPWVGMAESATALFLLLLSILLPIWSLPEQILAGGTPQAGLTATGAANALLSGAALVLAFHRHGAAVRGAR